MSEQKNEPTSQYAKLRQIEIKSKFDETMFTLVHTGAVADLFLLKWLVSRQLNNIFVYGIQHDTDNIDNDRREEVHKAMFANIALTYNLKIEKTTPNKDELIKLDALAKQIVHAADSNTTGGKTNIITMTNPYGYFVESLYKHVRDSKSDVKHIIVLNSNIKLKELVNPPCNIVYVNADSLIHGSSAQKIIEAGAESDTHVGAAAMIKFIEDVSLNPMFNIFAYMSIVNAPNIEEWISVVHSDVKDQMENMESGHVSKSTAVTFNAIDDAVTALSYFIQGMLVNHTTY
jgi:hypothetical protein